MFEFVFLIFMWLIAFPIAIAIFIFWLWMLIDCLKREFEDKLVWVLVLILTGFLGAILYYFLVKSKTKEKKKK